MKRLLIALVGALLVTLRLTAQAPEYSIKAIRYATSPGVPLAELVVNGPKDRKVDIAMVVWLIREADTPFCLTAVFIATRLRKNFRCRITCVPTRRWQPPV